MLLRQSDLDLLQVYYYPNKIRLGRNQDNGYVVADVTGYDYYISTGPNDEDQISTDFMTRYGLDEYHGVTLSRELYNYSPKIRMIRKMLNSYEDAENTNLTYLLSQFSNIFLEVDMVVDEFAWLNSVSEANLSKFKQIVIEMDGLLVEGGTVPYEEKINCLRKLNNTHYLIHAHGNNNRPFSDAGIPQVLELTYLNKNCFVTPPEINLEPLPIPGLDFPNNPNFPDLDLNFPPFAPTPPPPPEPPVPTGDTGNTGNTDTGATGNTGNTDTGNTGNTDTGNTGNTDTGATGNTDTGNTGNTGNTDTGATGNTDTGNTGNTDTGATGNTDTGNTGNTDTGATGNTDTGATGNTGNTDTGATGNTGNTDTGNTGNTDTGNTGNTDTGNTGNTADTGNTGPVEP
jgi:hypothetical protein